MTLIELQDKLGKLVQDLTDDREPYENKLRIAQTATVVSSLAKQMINNADVVLRAEKLMTERKLENSAIVDMVSGKYMLLHKGDDGELVQKF